MKIFGDFLALILFFLTYWYSKDIRLATAVAIVVGVLQAAWTWWRSRRLETMQWVSLILIVVFGGATIWFNDPHFIMWKPTLLFWASAVAIGTGLLLKKNGLKMLMGKELSLPEPVWQRLAWAWLVFFVLMGCLNLAVAHYYSLEQWITYKTFGAMGLMLVFVLAQGFYMSKHLPPETQT